MNLTNFSTGIHALKKDHIFRKNYTFALKKNLDENKIVFLEGDADSGKTSICQEFCFENITNAVSIFFNPLNKIDYNVEYFLENVISQLRIYVDSQNNTSTSSGNIGIEEFQRLLFKIRKKTKKENLYFVIDGLDDNTKENNLLLKKIIEILPLGDANISLLISAQQKEFLKKNENLQKLETRSQSLLGFSEQQVSNFFAFDNIPISQDQIEKIIKITDGYPGKLQVCKKLSFTVPIEEIIENEFKKLIEIQCKKINIADNNINVLLSILALKDNLFTKIDLTKILEVDDLTFQEIIDNTPILEIRDEYVLFQSINYKGFFKNILRQNLKKVDDLLINFLSSSETINSKLQLSELYAENRQWGNVVSIIDESFLANAISTTESLKKVNNSIGLAHQASIESKNTADLFKFSVQGSIINDFENTQNLDSEIRARLAINDVAGAINLAESTLLRINRLKLLSSIAKTEKEINNNVDEDLINTIINLYKTVDFTDAGEKIYDIVANLMYVIPHLALELIESSSSTSEEHDINEWIIAKLSVASIKSENSGSVEEKESNEKLIEKIESNNSKKISKAVSFLVGNYDAGKVLEEVQKISDSKEKLKLLRIWLSNNKQNTENIELVIEKALDELISSSSESILSLESLKDITYQLPYIKKISTKERLYQRFIKLDKEIKEIGLDKDRYVYELNLFHALFTMYKDKSIVKLSSILNNASKIDDSLIKIEVFCEIYNKLIKISSPSFSKSKSYIKDVITKLNIDLLQNAANHHNISKQYLKTLSSVDIDFCTELISYFNTQTNRDKARIHCLSHYLDNNLKHITLEKLDLIKLNFETNHYLNYFYLNILDRFSESKGLHFTIINYSLKFIEEIEKSTLSFSNKIFCFVQLYKIVSKNEEIKYHKNRFLKSKIEECWEKVDEYWDKVNIGFFVCAELSEIDKAFSINIFKKSDKLKNESWISSEETSKTYIYSISIVLKSFIGLNILGVNTHSHYKNLETLIDRIPSEAERLELWTEVGFNLLLENKLELAQKIYNNHVLLLLQGVILKPEAFSSCVRALVLTHHYNPNLAIDYINEIDNLTRNEVYDSICEFYVTRKNPYEIYEGEILHSNCTYNDILKALPVLEKITKDVFIYSVITSIQKAITDKNSSVILTQKKEIARRLSEIISKKLPDVENIKHNGYKIICEVKIALINRDNSNWKNLYDESQTIPNFSDRIFVKANLLEHIPFDRAKMINKSTLFDEIVEDLKNLNNNYEYIERINEISEIMYDAGKTKWKKIVEDAFSVTNKIGKENISYRYQKALIDTIFRLDSDFAKELLNSIENKNSMKNEYLKDYYMSLEIAKKIKNNQTIEQKETENSRVILKGVVNTLAAFNSGKTSIRKPDEMNKYLNLTYKLPLKECLALYHYYFANCNKHTPPKNSESKYGDFLLKLFEDSIKSTNLIEIIATNRKKNSASINFDEFSSNLPLKPGNREEAIKFIQEWVNDEVEDFLVFADPYFEAKDIEFAKLLKQAGKDDITLEILTHKFIEQEDIEREWKRVSVENIPYINITFCNIQNENKCPFHDRWLITKNGGLRIGTSFNSMGISRDSEISTITNIDADNIYQTILRGYVERTKREHNFQKLSYKSYSL